MITRFTLSGNLNSLVFGWQYLICYVHISLRIALFVNKQTKAYCSALIIMQLLNFSCEAIILDNLPCVKETT